jgi:hypothetical protein
MRNYAAKCRIIVARLSPMQAFKNSEVGVKYAAAPWFDDERLRRRLDLLADAVPAGRQTPALVSVAEGLR